MRRVIWVAWLSGSLVVADAPSILAAQNGPAAAQSGATDSQALKPREVLERGVRLHYNGDFEEADVWLQQAAQVRSALTPNEQAQLDDTQRRNGEAVKGRKAAIELIAKTSSALERGQTKEAEQYLKALRSSRYLNQQDRQVVDALASQARGKPMAPAGKANLPTKQDPDTLMAEARKACDRKDYDQAEALALAARNSGYSWNLPWSDNPDKVLKEVAAGRAKMGAKPSTNSVAAAATQPAGKRGLFDRGDAAAAAPAGGNRTAQARETLKQATMACRAGDFVAARTLLKQAEDMKVNLPVWEEFTVEKVRTEIQRAETAAASGGKASVIQAGANGANAGANAGAAPAPTGDARTLVKEARAALNAGDLDRAEMLARAARNQHTEWGLFEDTADKALADVNKAKEAQNHVRADALLVEARKLMEAGRFDDAEKLTWQAEALRKNYPLWRRGDRPDRLRAEINDKRKAAGKPNLPPLIDPAGVKAPSADAVAGLTKGGPMSVAADPKQQQAQAMMAQARIHLNRGEHKAALDLAVQVKNMNVAVAAGGDTPDQIIAAVQTVMAAGEMRANPAQAAAVRMQALQHLAEARLLQKQKKLNEAMECVAKARRLNAFYQPADETPEMVAAELKQAAIAQVKVFTDAAETLAKQNKVKESVEYFNYVQSLALTFSLDAAPAAGRIAQLQASLVVPASAAPTMTAAPVAAAPAAPTVAQAAPPASVIPAAAPSAPPMAAPSMAAPAMTLPTVAQAAPAAEAPKPEAPKVEENKGQELVVQAQQALRAGQLQEARKLAEALYTGPYQMQQQANVLLTQIDEAADKAASLRCVQALELMQRAAARKEFDLARSYADQVDAKKLPADLQPQFSQLMAMKEMQPAAPQIVQTQASMPAAPEAPKAAPAAVAQATAAPAQPAKDSKGGMIDEVRARQEIELQRVRELKRQCELKASQLVGKGDFDGAVEELQGALTQVQKANLDKDLSAKLEKQLNQRIGEYKTLAEKVAFGKMQKDKLGDAADKKMRILAARERQRDEVTKLMKEYASFMNEGKFVEAENAAMKARELDPDNVQAEVGIFKARAMRTLTDENRIKSNRDKAVNAAMLDLTESAVPYANDDQPVVVNPKIMAIAKNRKPGQQPLPRTPSDKETYGKLDSMVSVDFKNKPLSYVLDELRTMSGANIVPQDEFLKSENISLDCPVDIKLSNVSLKTALNLILSKARLTYLVRDGVVLVTTQAGKQQEKVTATYQVADLIVPRDDMATLNPGSALRMGSDGSPVSMNWSKSPVNGDSASSASMANGPLGGDSSGKSRRQVGQTLERQLIELITQTIEPQTWNTMGGAGNVAYYPHGMTLVVSQTPDIQEQIEALLARLRELQELQVTVEVRFITITEDFFERVGVDMDVQLRTASNSFNRQVALGQFGPPGQLNTIGNPNTIVGLTPSGSDQYAFTNSLTVPINNSSFFRSALPSGFAGFPGSTGNNGGLDVGLAFLSNIQVFLFMEAVQGDIRTNVLTAPKVTLFNGQTAQLISGVNEPFILSVTAQRDLFTGSIVFIPQTTIIQTGLVLSVQAVVTADRRYVQLSLNPSISRIREIRTFQALPGLTLQQPVIETLQVTTTVQVPDGGTILMGGLKEMSEQRREFGPPILSKIPYINRLFRNSMYGREGSSLLLMVTPRIIIPEEEEERLGQTFTF